MAPFWYLDIRIETNYMQEVNRPCAEYTKYSENQAYNSLELPQGSRKAIEPIRSEPIGKVKIFVFINNPQITNAQNY
jgi:hypothetical protein